MPYQESTPPPLQVLIGLGFSMLTDTMLEKKIAPLLHPACFEIIALGASKELKDYLLCGSDLARLAGELSRDYARSEFGRPALCITINQAVFMPGNSTSPPVCRRHIIEMMSVLEEGRPLHSGGNLNRRHLQRSMTDTSYRGNGTIEAINQVARFIMSRLQTLQKKLPLLRPK